MDAERIARLESSFALLAPRGPELVEHFYQGLFEAHPGVRELFPTDMMGQQGKLLASLVAVVNSLRNLDEVVPTLHELGKRHVAYGAVPAHYDAVRDSLVASMHTLAGEAWSETLTEDWTAALDIVAKVMLEGAEAA